MKFWLLKTEPAIFSWETLLKDKITTWDGVRNYQATNYLKEIEIGDQALIYHTGDEKQIVGIATIVRGAYPEPKAPDWVAIDLKPERALNHPVTLAQIKKDIELKNMTLIKASRLSVQPVLAKEFARIVKIDMLI